MNKGLSSHLFVEQKLSVSHLKSIFEAGFSRLEIFAMRPHFDYRDKKTIVEIAAWIADQTAFLSSIHTPFCMDYQAKANGEWLSIAEPEKVRREKAVDEIRRSLEFAEKVVVPLGVVHMGAPGDRFSPRHMDALYYSLEILVPFASSRGVKLALENIPNQLSRIEDMRRFIEDAALDDVGICFDSGHSNLRTTPESEISESGSRIISTHLHDNLGSRDDHLLPFQGNIDWSKVLEAFSATDYQGPLILELKASNDSPEEVLNKAIQVFDRFDRCNEERLEMKAREG